jgi:hypothetical protein
MYSQSVNCSFNAEGRKDYQDWLAGTLAVYGVVVLCSILAVALLSTSNIPNTEEFLTTAVALASP